MSSNTRIIVLKSKELIFTGVFILLGILLIFLLFHMFSSSDDKGETSGSTTEEATPTMASYTPGVYSTSVNIGGSNLELSVTVDDECISNVSITNLDETVTAMYPLIQPTLDEINAQISTTASLDDITYSGDSKYTNIILLEAIKKALEPAVQ